MTYAKLILGLSILKGYAPEGLETTVCAEHDQIFCLPPGEAKDITEEHLAALKACGFAYSPSEGWTCFT